MSASSVLSSLRMPIVVIVVAAVLIRLVLMPLLTYDFDIYHWALVISNINSGNNLYNLDGYYYTPVWGYILGFISTAQQFLVDIGVMGIRFTDMLPIENLQYPYHIATATSISFNVAMKIPMLICDLAVGYLVYWLIKDRTRSTRKATYGLAFWLFCPIVVYMTGVQAMFDSFSALLLMLTVIMFYKDKCFIGGALFSMAILLKFFPAFAIFVLLAYVLVKHRDDGLAKKKLIESLAGMAIMGVILMLPLALNGQLGDAFTFIFGRASESSLFNTLYLVINAAIAIPCAFFFGYKMYKSPSYKADSTMFAFVMYTVLAAVLLSVTPQYVIVVLPLVILHMVAVEKTYVKYWYVISFAAFFCAFALNNFSLFSALATYTTFISPGWLINGMLSLESTIFHTTFVIAFAAVASAFLYAGIFLLVFFGLADNTSIKLTPLRRLLMWFKGKEDAEDET